LCQSCCLCCLKSRRGRGSMSDDEAKLNIATYFIMSSPTGEVNDVVNDVSRLVGDPNVLSEEALTNIMHNYNVDQMVFAANPDDADKLTLVTAHNKVSKDQFSDPNTGKTYKFDHRKGKFSDAKTTKDTLSSSVEKYRAAVQKSLDSYLETTYKSGKVVGVVYGTNAGKLTVCISAKNVHLSNFWTGAWRSTFGVQVDKTSSSAELKGTIKVNVHYFEDGNVQLHSTLDKAATLTVASDADATATEIVKAVGKIENDFQSSLEDMYVKMHSTTFKAMRRFYPVTRQPMVWNLAAHQVSDSLSGGGAKTAASSSSSSSSS